MRVDYSNGADHPELIKFCLECTSDDCKGICNAWRDRYRELYGYPAIDRHRKPVNNRNPPKYAAFGEEHSLSEWAKIKGVPYTTLQSRMHRGITLEDALLMPTDPKNGKGTYIVIGGVAMTITEWLREKGVPRSTYYWRVRNGWSEEKAIMTPAGSGDGRDE